MDSPGHEDELKGLLKQLINLLKNPENVVRQQRTSFEEGEGRSAETISKEVLNLQNKLAKQRVRAYLFSGCKAAQNLSVTDRAKYAYLLSDNPLASKSLETALNTRENLIPQTLKELEEMGITI